MGEENRKWLGVLALSGGGVLARSARQRLADTLGCTGRCPWGGGYAMNSVAGIIPGQAAMRDHVIYESRSELSRSLSALPAVHPRGGVHVRVDRAGGRVA
jgi:hypothetical protein